MARRKRALMVASVYQSLLFQSPMMLTVLNELGFDLTFAAGVDKWRTQLSERGQVHDLALQRRPTPAVVRDARRELGVLMAKGAFDLVQVQSPVAAAAVRTVPGLATVPSLYVAHGFHFQRGSGLVENVAYGVVELALAGRTTALAVVAEEDYRVATKLGFGRRTRLWRLPGAGVETQPAFAFSPRSVRGTPTALFVGELNANKNPLLAVEAVRLARRQGVEVELLLVGSGPLDDQVERLRARHDWLSWLPQVPFEDMPRLMRQCHLLLAPSRREGVPRVIIEAMASGLPVVATSNRGSRELLNASTVSEVLPAEASPTDWIGAIARVIARAPSVEDSVRMQAYSNAAFAASYRGLIETIMAAGTRTR